MQEIILKDLGLIDYKEAWDYQESLFNELTALKLQRRESEGQASEPKHYFLFCEHPHVYTLGKSGEMANLLINNETLKKKNISFYPINRGGDITYHGPGQVVGYPILDLDFFFTDIHKYLRLIEETIIRTLSDLGIEAGRKEGATGVWLDAQDPRKARKICAIGIRCSRWITMHGFAFNVNTDLDLFNFIVPCGINDGAVTSMQKELGYEVDMDNVRSNIKEHFGELFDAEFIIKNEPAFTIAR